MSALWVIFPKAMPDVGSGPYNGSRLSGFLMVELDIFGLLYVALFSTLVKNRRRRGAVRRGRAR